MQCLYLQPECSNVGSRIPAIVVAQDTITSLKPTSSLLTKCANVSPVRNSEIQSPSAWEQPTIPGQLIHQEQIRTKGSRRARLSVHVRLLRRHQSKCFQWKRQISLRSMWTKRSLAKECHNASRLWKGKGSYRTHSLSPNHHLTCGHANRAGEHWKPQNTQNVVSKLSPVSKPPWTCHVWRFNKNSILDKSLESEVSLLSLIFFHFHSSCQQVRPESLIFIF